MARLSELEQRAEGCLQGGSSHGVLDGSIRDLGPILGKRHNQGKDQIREMLSFNPHVLESMLVAIKRTDFKFWCCITYLTHSENVQALRHKNAEFQNKGMESFLCKNEQRKSIEF